MAIGPALVEGSRAAKAGAGLVSLPALNTQEWREWRRRGLGASDAAVLTGDNPWRGERELALEKRGEIPVQERETDVQSWGHRVEQVAADIYTETTGKRLARINRAVTDKRWPYLFAHPDRRVIGERRLVEVKSSWKAWDDVPRYVQVQALHQMGLTNSDAVDVALLTAFGGFSVYTVERDDLLIRELFELESAWWERYVLGLELPPVDASHATSRHLDRLEGFPEMAATNEQAALMARLRALYRVRDDVTKRDIPLLVNQIKESMVGSYALVGKGFRVSWKPSKGRTTTKWELVAQAYRKALTEYRAAIEEATGQPLGDGLDFDVIESLYTETAEGTRPFRPTWEDAEEEEATSGN